MLQSYVATALLLIWVAGILVYVFFFAEPSRRRTFRLLKVISAKFAAAERNAHRLSGPAQDTIDILYHRFEIVRRRIEDGEQDWDRLFPDLRSILKAILAVREAGGKTAGGGGDSDSGSDSGSDGGGD